MKRYISLKEQPYDYSDALFQKYIKEYSLQEKTFNINKDVDFIYNKFFKKEVEEFKKFDELPIIGDYGKISSSELTSKKAKEAHRRNPIIIFCGVFKEGNTYDSFNKVIHLSFNYSAIIHYRDKELFSVNDRKAIETEFSEERIKASIYHELSHWISDSIYNNYIYNLIAKVKNISELDKDREEKINKIKNLGLPNVNMTHYEIDAQIHGIKQIKRLYKKEWDNISLLDLFYKYVSLKAIAKSLYKMGEDIYKTWLKDLIKRMHREGLLGKNMRDFPEYKMIEQHEIEKLFLI